MAWGVICVGLAFASALRAETWTDSTGKFKIDATFVAVQGDKLVLKRANGTVLQVPLAKLDASSLALAKRLEMKAGAPGANVAPDVYLREMIAASEAGDYLRVWGGLPQGYQQDVHELIHSFAANMDPQFWNQIVGTLKKGTRVLNEKQSFILGHPQAALAGEALPKVLPPLAEVLDAVVNSQLTDLSALKKFDMVQFAAGDGKKIATKMKLAGEAAKELQKLAPGGGGIPGAGEGSPFGGLSDATAADVQITVVKHEGDSATLRIQVKDKTAPDEEWVRTEGKWLPKKLVDQWQPQMEKAKAWTSGEMKQKLAGVKAQAGLFLPVVNLTFDQLLAAQSQEQFNQVITQVQQQLSGGAPPNK